MNNNLEPFYKEEAGVIWQGDVLEVLKQLETESVDLVMTSPPYYGLRNYGVDGQIGLENTFDEFLDKMMLIFVEVKRVLKKTGTFWLNMGDCYGGSNNGSNDYEENGKSSVPLKSRGPGAKRLTYWGGNVEKSTLTNPERQQLMGRSGNQKCMLMQPERMAIRMIDELGFILRNKIKWCKQVYLFKDKMTKGSVMPTSVKDRFNESGEELYFFVKSKKYFFDLDAVRLPVFEPNIERPRIGQNQFQNFNYRVRDTERKAGQPQFKATEEEIKKYKNLYDIPMANTGFFNGEPYKQNNPHLLRLKSLDDRMADTKNKDTKSSRTANIKKLLSEVRLGIKPNTGMESNMPNMIGDPRGNHAGGPGSWRDFKEQNPNDGKEFNIKGKNLPTIWQIGSEPHNFQKEFDGIDVDHFAIFPQALCEIPIKAGCPNRICKKCGKISKRITEKEYIKRGKGDSELTNKEAKRKSQNSYQENFVPNKRISIKTVGYDDCNCDVGFKGGVVLDIFSGSGTTLLVAKKLGRKFIGIDLNEKYNEIAKKRLQAVPQSLF